MEVCSYISDLTDAEWALLEPLIPPARRGGRPRTTDMREAVNALLYLLRTGCQWIQLPRDFPPKSTVHGYFRQWQIDGDWARILHHLLLIYREKLGREPSPSAVILDSQSVKAAERGAVAWTRRASMRARRSKAASATSRSTRMACCSE